MHFHVSKRLTHLRMDHRVSVARCHREVTSGPIANPLADELVDVFCLLFQNSEPTTSPLIKGSSSVHSSDVSGEVVERPQHTAARVRIG